MTSVSTNVRSIVASPSRLHVPCICLYGPTHSLFIIKYTSVCMYLTHFAWILSKLNLIKYTECIILLYCC